jgi:hypothetical protein
MLVIVVFSYKKGGPGQCALSPLFFKRKGIMIDDVFLPKPDKCTAMG